MSIGFGGDTRDPGSARAAGKKSFGWWRGGAAPQLFAANHNIWSCYNKPRFIDGARFDVRW